MAINAPGNTPISHHDDRMRDQRADAAQAGLHTGRGSGSEGDPRGDHWQRKDPFHRGSAPSPGRGGQILEPGRAEEVLPDLEARNDLGVVSTADPFASASEYYVICFCQKGDL